jgi:enolase
MVVGTAAQQSKFGAVTRGERLAKYTDFLKLKNTFYNDNLGSLSTTNISSFSVKTFF